MKRMIVRAMPWIRCLAVLLMACSNSPTALGARVTIDFNEVGTAAQGYVNDRNVINTYLSEFGVSTPNAPTVLNTSTYATYDNSPTTNVITGGDGRDPTVLTFEFERMVTDVSFIRVGTIGANSPSGTIAGDWTATAYDEDGAVLSTVGEGLVGFYGDRPSAAFTLGGGGIKRVVFHGFDHGFAGINTPHVTLIAFDESPGSVAITRPSSGAMPRSQFAAIAGTANPGASIQIRRNSVPVGNVIADAEGTWEALVYLLDPSGATPEIKACDAASLDCSDKLTLNDTMARSGRWNVGPVTAANALLPLRTADVLVTAARHSPQYKWYGPSYTHAALYVGGASDGTPLVGEAIPGGAEVYIAPLDNTTVWTEADRLSGFTPRSPLSNAVRDSIVQRARSLADSGASYWKANLFNLTDKATRLWFAAKLLGYSGILDELKALKESTSELQCATFVWRSYYDGTGRSLDISLPNLMSAEGRLSGIPDLVLEDLRPVLVVPETFARSPHFRQIF